MVIYGINRNFWGRFPGKIFLGELLAVQPMVDARKVVFVAYKAEVNFCLWTLGPGNTPSYYLTHFIILKKIIDLGASGVSCITWDLRCGAQTL